MRSLVSPTHHRTQPATSRAYLATLRRIAEIVPDPADTELITRDVDDDYLVAFACEHGVLAEYLDSPRDERAALRTTLIASLPEFVVGGIAELSRQPTEAVVGPGSTAGEVNE